MTSFQWKRDRIGWKWYKKKSYHSDPFQPARKRKFQNNSKEMQKIKKHHYDFISRQNGTGQAESDTKKKKLSFRSIPNRPRIGNFKKIKKTSIWLNSKQKWDGTGREWYKKKVIVSIHSNSTRNRDFQKKKAKKMQKIKNHRCGFISSQNRKGQAESDTKKRKVIIPIHSNPRRNRKFQKYSKDMQKIKKHHCGFNSRQNGMVPAKSDTKKKKKFSFRFISTRSGQGNSQKIAKKCRNLKNIIMASFQAKTVRTGWEWFEKNVIVPIHSNLTQNREF